MDANKEKETVVIFGATSMVAKSVIRLIAKDCSNLILIARNKKNMRIVAQDASIRSGAIVHEYICDASDQKAIHRTFESISNKFDQIDVWYSFHGTLPDQKASENSWYDTYEVLNINFLSICHWLTLVAERIETGKRENIVVVSSVAGLRGRKSNYLYGTSKGALNIFLQGLRNRLSSNDCQVLTVLPGFIISPMTDGLQRKGPLWAKPEKIASDIVRAQKKGKDVLYTPWFWRYIMLVICAVPERIFKKLSL